MVNRGGAREGAGRPQRRYLRGQAPTGETPIEKLWVYLAEQFGEEEAEKAHLFFNEQKREYEKRRRDAVLAEREERKRKL
jgi:hypothetical protein